MKLASPRTLPHAFFALATTLGLAAAVLPAAPAQAAPRGTYTATLAAPLDAPRKEIIDGLMWRCEGETCTAPANGSRTVITCQRVATEFGPIAAFESPKGDLTAEELARCNAD